MGWKGVPNQRSGLTFERPRQNGDPWWPRAMCAGASVELFYPEGKRFAALQAQVIADYCDVCPVVRECLAASLAEEDGAALSHRFGVRGGLGPAQRFELAQLREGPEAVAMLDAGALALE